MTIQEQINDLIISQPEVKCSDLRTLHQLMLKVLPEGKLWFFDGKNSDNKTVSNPTIGYGSQMISDVKGGSREFFLIGISPNKTGISVYILGIKDRTYLARMYGERLGKASVTGYCIRFKSLKEVNLEVLEEAIRNVILSGGEIPI